MDRDALKATVQARLQQSMRQTRQQLDSQAQSTDAPSESQPAETTLRSIAETLGLDGEPLALIPPSGRMLPGSGCSATPAETTSVSPSSISSITGAVTPARATRPVTGRPAGVPGAASPLKVTGRQDLQALAVRDPEACRAAWQTYLPPALQEQMAGIHRSKLRWRTEGMPNLIEVPDLVPKAFCVFVGQRGVRDLQRFLHAVGDAGEIPDHGRLLKLVKTGIAQFGDRAVRDMEASEGVAAARLIPWTEALAGLPEWAIAAAFTRCNQATHPPRPVEVKEVAHKAAEGLPWFIIRARAILRHVQQTRPEWLEGN